MRFLVWRHFRRTSNSTSILRKRLLNSRSDRLHSNNPRTRCDALRRQILAVVETLGVVAKLSQQMKMQVVGRLLLAESSPWADKLVTDCY